MPVKNFEKPGIDGGINATTNPGYETPNNKRRVPELADHRPEQRQDPRAQNRNRNTTMAKWIVTTSVVLLGLSVVLSYADQIFDRATLPGSGDSGGIKLPPQSVVSAVHFTPLSSLS